MENRLKITNTAYPDGTVVMYLHGMSRPQVKNLGSIMKQAAFLAVTSDNVQAPVRLKKHLSKAG